MHSFVCFDSHTESALEELRDKKKEIVSMRFLCELDKCMILFKR